MKALMADGAGQFFSKQKQPVDTHSCSKVMAVFLTHKNEYGFLDFYDI